MKHFLTLFSFVLLSFCAYSQNNVCANPQPFCTGQTMQFPAGVNAGSAQSGPNYGCLGSQPNPAWFYFQIGTAGPLTINMSASFDIDYIAYGPFPTLGGNCGNLTAGNTVGCSYSGSANETLNIANAVAGQFYLLLITNFSNANQQITFSQTNSGVPGAAQTNCGVLCSMTVTGTSSLCPGKTATLSATTGTAVTAVNWSGPGGFSASGNNVSIPNVLTSGVYTAVASTSGPTCAITRTITVLPTPNPLPNNNGPVCPGSPVNLSVGAFATYTWTGPGFSSNAQNPVVNPAVAGVYSVAVTSAAGCTNVASTTVAIAASPTAVPNNNGPVCAGTVLSLTGSGGGTYSWTGPNAFSSGTQNPNINNVTTAASGVYTLMVTVGTCTNKATTTVVINPQPVAVAGNNGPLCQNNQLNLTGNGGTTYTWTGPGGFTSNSQNPNIPNAQPANAGVYTLSVTNASGCTGSITTNVVINPTPAIVVNNPAACVNQNINLTANGGSTYQWSGPNGFTSNAQNPVITNAQLTMNGAYTVTVTTAAGCTNTAVSNVTVITLPNPTILSNTPCVGATLSFTGGGGATYQWYGPNGFNSANQNPTIANVTAAANGIYTLVASAGSCSNSVAQNVIINPLPVPVANSNNPLCENTTLNLTGNGGTTYTWTGPAGFTSNNQNPSIPNTQLSATGIYSLLVTNANGCTNSITVNVVVNPTPAIVVNNPAGCVNQNINLTANGGSTYSWSGPAGFTSNAQNPVLTNAQMNMNGAYTVTVTTAAGCTNTAVSNVTVINLPTPAIVSNTPCVGSTLNLNGSGGASYSWSGPNGFASALQNPAIANVTPAEGGLYTLVATAGSCSGTIIAMITINPLPNPTINSNSPVCANQALTFTATGGTGYSWSGPNGFTSTNSNVSIPSANSNFSGTYTVTVTDANGCTNFTTSTAVVNPLPIVSAVGSTVCVPKTATLAANGGVSYSWTGPLGFTSNSQFPSLNNTTTGMTGQYNVTVTDANGCVNNGSAFVQVNSIPNPVAAANSPICVKETIMLNANAGGAQVSYAWSGPAGFLSSSSDPQISQATTGMSGQYTVTITDNTGCSSSAVVSMVVNDLPDGTISTNSKFGCVPFCATFSVNASTPLQSVTWDMGLGGSMAGTTVKKCYTQDGMFPIKANFTDANGCSNSNTYTVQVYPLPTADFNMAPQKPVVNEEVVFTNASYGGNIISTSWNFSHLSPTVTTQYSPMMIFSEAGSYVVALIVQNDKGCKDTLIRPFFIGEDYGIYVPNAFSPNGDGMNDIFQPKGYGIVKYELNIFDRWGEKLFSTTNFEEGWKGNYVGRNDESVPVGVYTWHIKLINVQGRGKEMTGKVTVIR